MELLEHVVFEPGNEFVDNRKMEDLHTQKGIIVQQMELGQLPLES
jgi:hypothetical protein